MVEWANLRGGKKNMELMADKDFIIGCNERFGPRKTCELYGITKLETLLSVLDTDDRGRLRKLDKATRALMKAEVAVAGYEETNRALNQALSFFERKLKRHLTIEHFEGWLIREVDSEELV